MEQECLQFFKEKHGNDFQLEFVRNYPNKVTFTIKNVEGVYRRHCIELTIQKDLSLLDIVLVTKCTLPGEETIKTVLEFAVVKGISSIELLDASEIDYVLSTGEEKSVSLYELSMLKKGHAWYESFGFRNEINEYKDFWIYCIHQPFSTTYDYLHTKTLPNNISPLINEHKAYLNPIRLKKYGLNTTDSVSKIFTTIQQFLITHCPKLQNNRCTSEIMDSDFIYINGFIQKSFQLLMLTLCLTHETVSNWSNFIKRVETFRNYKLTFFPKRTMVSVSGKIGFISGIFPGYYEINFPDKKENIEINRVKLVNEVMLHGLTSETGEEMNNSVGKIVGLKPKRYIVNLGDRKYSVKYQNVKALGGKSRKKYKLKRTRRV